MPAGRVPGRAYRLEVLSCLVVVCPFSVPLFPLAVPPSLSGLRRVVAFVGLFGASALVAIPCLALAPFAVASGLALPSLFGIFCRFFLLSFAFSGLSLSLSTPSYLSPLTNMAHLFYSLGTGKEAANFNGQ